MGVRIDEQGQRDAAGKRRARRIAELAAARRNDLGNPPVVDQDVDEGEAVAIDRRGFRRQAGSKDPGSGDEKALSSRESKIAPSRVAAPRIVMPMAQHDMRKRGRHQKDRKAGRRNQDSRHAADGLSGSSIARSSACDV